MHLARLERRNVEICTRDRLRKHVQVAADLPGMVSRMSPFGGCEGILEKR
jgi:hypothetical protein